MARESALGQLLSHYALASVARAIDRPRAFVWRLRQGQPLRDESVIPALSDVLRVEAEHLRSLVESDAVAWRKERGRRERGCPL